jgi:RNA polymerase sigma-70 factor, ECF subfamily
MKSRQDEFERVALCHSRSLLRVARRLTLGSSAAEDLVQECLLLAWRSFDQFDEGTNARAWLFRILFNVFYAHGRKLRRVPEIIPITRDLASAPASLDEAMEVSRALDGLHIDHRTVLMLGVVEGFTCGEIAGILEIPVGTVMSRLSRARVSMRTRLAAKPLNLQWAEKEIS